MHARGVSGGEQALRVAGGGAAASSGSVGGQCVCAQLLLRETALDFPITCSHVPGNAEWGVNLVAAPRAPMHVPLFARL